MRIRSVPGFGFLDIQFDGFQGGLEPRSAVRLAVSARCCRRPAAATARKVPGRIRAARIAPGGGGGWCGRRAGSRPSGSSSSATSSSTSARQGGSHRTAPSRRSGACKAAASGVKARKWTGSRSARSGRKQWGMESILTCREPGRSP